MNFGLPDIHIYRSARTDAEGHYSVDFPTGGMENGMVVWVVARGFREGQIADPPKASYLDRSDEDRRAAAAEMSEMDMDPIPIYGRYESDAKLLPLDLALIPERAKASPVNRLALKATDC